jgi:hypothetical protein
VSFYQNKDMSYDLNGNIMSLLRKAAGSTADNLTYGYTGNQLDAVTDASTYSGTENHFVDGNKSGNDYTYDANEGRPLRKCPVDIFREEPECRAGAWTSDVSS